MNPKAIHPLVFFGSAPFSLDVLSTIMAANRYQIVAVVTTADKPAGRGLKLTPNPVKTLANQHHIPVFDDIKTFLASATPPNSIGLVAAYGKILGPKTLSKLNNHIYGIHPSILPKFRGPSPLQFQILTGLTASGVTVFQIDQGEDTGPIVAQQPAVIHPADTWITLGHRLFSLGASLFLSLDLKASQPTPQIPNQATSTRKITRQDGFIPWAEFSSALNTANNPPPKIQLMLRAFTNWPGVWTLDPSGKRVKLLSLNPPTIQYESKNPQPW